MVEEPKGPGVPKRPDRNRRRLDDRCRRVKRPCGRAGAGISKPPLAMAAGTNLQTTSAVGSGVAVWFPARTPMFNAADSGAARHELFRLRRAQPAQRFGANGPANH